MVETNWYYLSLFLWSRGNIEVESLVNIFAVFCPFFFFGWGIL